jgi:hypothetical protein
MSEVSASSTRPQTPSLSIDGDHPDLQSEVIGLRLKMLKAVCSMLFRSLRRSIDEYHGQIISVIEVADHESMEGVKISYGDPMEELKNLCKHAWIFDHHSRWLAFEIFDHNGNDVSIPANLYVFNSEILEGIDTVIMLGKKASDEFHYFVKKRFDRVKTSFYFWLSRWYELLSTLRKQGLSISCLDTPYYEWTLEEVQ